MATKTSQKPTTPVDPGKELTKGWIQYLKNNRIVKMQSDPKSGKLSYNRDVTTDDISKFLMGTGKFDKTTVNAAIQKTLANKPPKAATGTDMPTRPFTTPGAAVPDKDGKIPAQTTADKKLSQPAVGTDMPTKPYATPGSVTPGPGGRLPAQVTPDKKLSQTPDAIRKRKQRAAAAQQDKSGQAAFSRMAGQLGGKKGVNEDFQDTPGRTVDENDVEKILRSLAAGQLKKSRSPANTQVEPTAPELSPEEKIQKKQEEVRNFKRMIRDTMSDGQRKALWRALNDI